MSERTYEWAISAGVVATVLVVGFDLPSATSGLIVLTFLLVAPGLAMSLHLGPMGIEARALVTIVGSVATATLTALAMISADAWSSDLGVAAVALVTQLTVVLAMWRRRDATPPRTAVESPAGPSEPSRPTEHRP